MAAVALTLAVAAVYFYRTQQARLEQPDAPAVVPPTVEQRAAEFSFSKLEGQRKLFTVRASRATDFAEGGGSLLEDVWVTVYGARGDRFDNLHARECSYSPADGRVTCKGQVRVEVGSPREHHPEHDPGEELPASPQAITIVTTDLRFAIETGIVRTDEPVEFRFPGGEGRGMGLSYRTREGVVRLERDVELHLEQAGASEAQATLHARQMEFRRDARTLRLLEQVRGTQNGRTLAAGELVLALDAEMRPQELTARGQPQLESAEGPRRTRVSGDEFFAQLSPGGNIERLRASGKAGVEWSDAAGQDQLRAARIEVALLPSGEIQQLIAQGDVRFASRHSGETRALETDSLEVTFAAGQPQQARALASAVVEWRRGEETLRIAAVRLDAEFDARGQLTQLAGREGVELERRLPGRLEQVSRSREFAMRFGADGNWSEVTQAGGVRIRSADRSAQAEQARLARAEEELTLRGGAVVSDPATRTTAEAIVFLQRAGEMRAEGNVRTSYLAAAGGPGLADEPAHLAAARLEVDTEGGRAVYSGGARLWQGDAVVEAESIELDRAAATLLARGGVTALLPQAASESSAAARPVVWRVTTGRLVYRSEAGRIELQERVVAESALGRIRAPRMELELGQGEGTRALRRAVASGGVNITAGQRRASAETAEYTAAEGKFVLSGGTPMIQDASLGTVTGRKLTFTSAGDKILVESEEGSRTLTRHRVDE